MSDEKEKMESILTENRIFDPVKLNPDWVKTGISFRQRNSGSRSRLSTRIRI